LQPSCTGVAHGRGCPYAGAKTGKVTRPETDPGSFRDPDSRVFAWRGALYRAMTDDAMAAWQEVAAGSAFERLRESRRLVETGVAPDEVPLPDGLDETYVAVLRHERLPFVSYAYEWSFGMLRDAALLQLEVLEAALDRSLTLMDGSRYNVQGRGSSPVFIDVGSFDRANASGPWVGYGQFCSMFLYPLMLEAFRGVPFQPWLRGSLEGIPAPELKRLLSLRDRARRGVFSHVVLHARMVQRESRVDSGEAQKELADAGFGPDLVRANARRLHRLLERMPTQPTSSHWLDYPSTGHYSDEAAQRKLQLVGDVVARHRGELVWDLGCNDARHARVAADHAGYVVAMDSDPAVIDAVYEQLKAAGDERVLPLVIDLADPSPDRGWAGVERRSLQHRGDPGVVIALALVHHLSIGRNVPLESVVEWLSQQGSTLLVEFAQPEDPMVRSMLARKPAQSHADYSAEAFEAALSKHMRIEHTEQLAPDGRLLYVGTRG
jgi:hypothetical protein